MARQDIVALVALAVIVDGVDTAHGVASPDTAEALDIVVILGGKVIRDIAVLVDSQEQMAHLLALGLVATLVFQARATSQDLVDLAE